VIYSATLGIQLKTFNESIDKQILIAKKLSILLSFVLLSTMIIN